jgi:hypothetical protein
MDDIKKFTIELKSNKDIEKLLKNGNKLIVVTRFEENKEVELSFFIDKETSENEITQQQFDEYMVLCDNSDTSEFPKWKIGETYRCYYWL